MNNGGPAFPMPGYFPDDPEERLEPSERRDKSNDPQHGMSLRDYFAGQALAGYLADPNQMLDDDNIPIIANECYELADAMLAARQPKKEK